MLSQSFNRSSHLCRCSGSFGGTCLCLGGGVSCDCRRRPGIVVVVVVESDVDGFGIALVRAAVLPRFLADAAVIVNAVCVEDVPAQQCLDPLLAKRVMANPAFKFAMCLPCGWLCGAGV